MSTQSNRAGRHRPAWGYFQVFSGKNGRRENRGWIVVQKPSYLFTSSQSITAVAPKRQIPEHNLRPRHPAEPEFRTISLAGYTRRHRNFPYHRHDFYEMLLVEQGQGVHEIDFRSYPVGPGG